MSKSNCDDSDKLHSKPFYVSANTRNSFLSQTGNFMAVHRRLFALLCDYWKPAIPYDYFVYNAGKTIDNIEKNLSVIMRQLDKSNCGLVTRDEQGNKPDRIILKEPNTSHYWYWSLAGRWQDLKRRPELKMPMVRKLVKKDLNRHCASNHQKSYQKNTAEGLAVVPKPSAAMHGRKLTEAEQGRVYRKRYNSRGPG